MSDPHPAPSARSDSVAVVVAGGRARPRVSRDRLPASPRWVIAADSGVGHALALGLRVDLVVGDLDSATPEDLATAEASGATVERHPVHKDQTDLELALDRAVQVGADLVIVVASTEGRLDHTLANLLVLAAPAYRHQRLVALVDEAAVRPIWDACEWSTTPGDLVTLLPVGGPAHGVRTAGLQYPLRSETLPSGSSRGVSNVAEAQLVRVALDSGVLLAIHQPPE
jgi:thiamine pyrophosphokinase